MLVGVDGERRVPVPEPFRHDLDRHVGFDEQGAVGVTDVVESDLRDSGSGGDPFEGLGDREEMDRVGVDVGEHPPDGQDPYCLLFGLLPGLPVATLDVGIKYEVAAPFWFDELPEPLNTPPSANGETNTLRAIQRSS
jgi:hypothetical protein